MRTIYIDADFKCHIDNAAGRTAIETEAFDSKCDDYIEGYRFVPNGETWTREDGTVFTGQMFAPWKPSHELEVAQREYERQQLADALAALETLGYTEGQ